MQASKLASGTILKGEYVLLGPIGEGGGHVFRAHQRRDRRLVAVRVWRGAAAAARNLDLAEAAMGIRHPMLASVEASGHTNDGIWFIVSEYMSGQRLDQWADKVGIPALSSVTEFVQRLSLAVNVLHLAGQAHRAINPRNLVGLRNEPGATLDAKLVDVGVPTFMRPRRLRAVHFMAPEQLAALVRGEGDSSTASSSRVDVYALGCVLYYLCTGGPPFAGRSLEELNAAHATPKLTLPSRINPLIPAALESVILRALSLDPSERQAHGAELASALDEVRRSGSVSGVMRRVSENVLQAGQPPEALASSPSAFDERPTSEMPHPGAEPLAESTPTRADTDDTLPRVVEGRDSSPEPARPSVPTVRPPEPPAAGRRSGPPPLVTRLSDPLGTPPRSASMQPVGKPDHDDAETLGAILSARTAPSGVFAAFDEAVLGEDADRPSPPRFTRPRLWAAAALAACIFALAYLRLRPESSLAVDPERATSSPRIAPAPTPEERALQAVLPPTPGVVTARQPALPAEAASSHSARSANTSPSIAPAVPTPVKRSERVAASPRRGVAAAARPANAALGVETEELSNREPKVAAESEAPPASVSERSEERRALETASETPAAEEVPPTAPGPRSTTGEKVGAPAPTAHALKSKTAIRALEVRGSLATSDVRRAIARMTSELGVCYSRAATGAGRDGFGEVRVEVTLDERGRAQNPHAEGAALPGLDACVARAMGRLVSTRAPDTGTVKANFRVAFVPRTP
jgi:serine/threonine protein kinase